MHGLRAVWRLLIALLHVLTGVLIALSVAVLARIGVKMETRSRLVRWWHRRFCRILGLRLSVQGEPSEQVGILISNHISWLDILVLGSGKSPMSFLSKAEVRSWPLVGWMAAAAGTLFIERGAGQSAHILEIIHDKLEEGASVLFFPEGTTSDGSDVLRFHPRLFAIAQKTGAPMQPVAVRYVPAPGRDNKAPYIDNDVLAPHAWAILKEPWIEVQIHYLETLQWDGEDRKALAGRSRNMIRSALDLPTEG